MLDNDFFSRYNDVHDKESKDVGIPGFQMNRPFVPLNKYKGRIGLELEIESNTPTPNEGYLDSVQGQVTKAKWTTVRDGSLRGDYAREYIVNKPIVREELSPMLNGLFECFAAMRSDIANSNRCSTHVHLNMGGKKINEITAVMCLWTIFEQSLINFCGEERMTNHFALSSSESNATLTAWEQYLRYGHANWDRNLKYQAMNVLPLFDKGSIEIRCGAAADDAQGPIIWATLLDEMVDFAINNYSKSLPRLGMDISERGGCEIFGAICDKDPVLKDLFEKVVKPIGRVDFDEMAVRGFRNCQSLVFSFPWDSWIKLIEKEYVPDPFASTKPSRPKPVGGFPVVPPRRLLRENAEVALDELLRVGGENLVRPRAPQGNF